MPKQVEVIEVRVDSRIRIALSKISGEGSPVADSLRDAFTHENPKYRDLVRGGYSVGSEPVFLRTWRHERDGDISLPRGGMTRVREVLRSYGYQRKVVDCRSNGYLPRNVPREFVPDKHLREPWSYQRRIIDACLESEQGIVRAATGAGKTSAAMGFIARAGLWSLVVVWTGGLFEQWVERVVEELGVPLEDVGLIGEGKFYLRPVTVAMQQSLMALSPGDLLRVDASFGVVVADELQRFAAPTLYDTIDPLRARYRLGFSADETRADGKEQLVYDLFGDVLEEVGLEEVEAAGKVLDVEVRVVPSAFRADWYRPAMMNGNEWQKRAAYQRLMRELSEDPGRNDLIASLAAGCVAEGEQVLVLIDRREHAAAIDAALTVLGVRTGRMLGGAASRKAFNAAKAGLVAGQLQAAVGTVKAVGTGIDVPAIARMVCASPSLLQNKQQLGQARGRVCRAHDASGKGDAVMYVVWDREVYGRKQLENVAKWNRTVVVRDGEDWVPARQYLARTKAAPTLAEVLGG